MWSFKIVVSNNDCDLKSCKNVDDYIKNLDECRGTAAVYRYTTAALSVIPLTGIGNFYSGRKFDAVFEIIEGIIALLVTCCCCCAYCLDNLHHHNDDDDNPLLCCELFWSLLLAVVSIVRCIMCTETSIENFDLLELFNHYEFYLAMVTVVISLIFCCCGCVNRRCWITSAILNVIVVAVMEISRDLYVAFKHENDPFI